MRRSTANIGALAKAITTVAVIGMIVVIRAEAQSTLAAGAMDASETAQAKIERAMSAGPTIKAVVETTEGVSLQVHLEMTRADLPVADSKQGRQMSLAVVTADVSVGGPAVG